MEKSLPVSKKVPATVARTSFVCTESITFDTKFIQRFLSTQPKPRINKTTGENLIANMFMKNA